MQQDDHLTPHAERASFARCVRHNVSHPETDVGCPYCYDFLPAADYLATVELGAAFAVRQIKLEQLLERLPHTLRDIMATSLQPVKDSISRLALAMQQEAQDWARISADVQQLLARSTTSTLDGQEVQNASAALNAITDSATQRHTALSALADSIEGAAPDPSTAAAPITDPTSGDAAAGSGSASSATADAGATATA